MLLFWYRKSLSCPRVRAWIRSWIATLGEVGPQPDDSFGDVFFFLLAREKAAEEGLRRIEVIEVVIPVADLVWPVWGSLHTLVALKTQRYVIPD